MKNDDDLYLEIDKLCEESEPETNEHQNNGKSNRMQGDENFNNKKKSPDNTPYAKTDDLDDLWVNNITAINFENRAKESVGMSMQMSDINTLIESSEIEEMMDVLKTENQKIFYEVTQKMNNVINEEEILTDFFEKRCLPYVPKETLIQLFQAMYYEKKLRSQEKNKLIEKQTAVYEQKMNNLKTLDLVIKKLSYDLNLFKHLNEIKNERHKGKAISCNMNNQSSALPELSTSEMYDWVVDVDLITYVFKEGWNVKFSKQFQENSTLNIQRHIIGDRANK